MKKDCRGFTTFTEFKCSYGTNVRVKESSAASSGPHIWLFLEQDNRVLTRPTLGTAAAHLTLAQAKRLAKSLLTACEKHYQLRANRTAKDAVMTDCKDGAVIL